MHTALLALAAAVLRGAFAAAPHRPNIVLFLTDDLDLMLGGMNPIHQPKYIPALRARGAEVSHWCVRQPSPEPLQGTLCLPPLPSHRQKRPVEAFCLRIWPWPRLIKVPADP